MSKAKHKVEPIILAALFVLYIVVLFKITVFRDTVSGVRSFNLVPFTTIAEYLKSAISGIRIMGIANLLGNLILFFPLGYMTASLFPRMRKLTRILLLVFGFSVAIEIIQYIFICGAADIDDVILNTLGGVAGYGLYTFLSRLLKPKKYALIISTLMIAVTCIGFYSFDNYRFLVDRSAPGGRPALSEPLDESFSEPFAVDEQPTANLSTDANTVDVQAYTDVIENISVDIMATNAYVINIDTNSILYEKNSNERIAPASTAKILAALTALDYFSLDDTFTVGSEIDLIASDSSKAGLNNGDTLTFRQLLVALLLPSGNDAAYTLAVNAGRIIAGDDSLNSKQAIKVFVNAMNDKAKEAGATSSNFVTPDGYDADGQYTTAVDLAQIAKVCLDNDILYEITSSYKIYDTLVNGREVVYSNTNELLNPNSQYYYSNAIGLKTGTTGNAGSCLISAATINEQTYICVVMGSSAGVRFSDCLAVFSAIDPTISLPVETGGASGSAPGGRARG